MIGPVAALGTAALAAVPFVKEALRTPVDDTLRAQAPGQFAQLSHGRTHYTWHGRQVGPVAICIHGLTTPSYVWTDLIPHLTEMGFRVLTYDLYGRGFSDRSKAAQSPAFFVQQLHELLTHLKLTDDLTLIGYSMGGVITAAYGAHHPHTLRRAVLIAPAGMRTDLGGLCRFAADWPLIGDWAFHMGYPRELRQLWSAYGDISPDIAALSDQMMQDLSRRGYLRAVLSSLRHSLRTSIPGIHQQLAGTGVPVGAIWGETDTAVPISGLGQLAQWNRDALQEVVDGAEHGLVFTHPQQVADAFRRVAGLA